MTFHYTDPDGDHLNVDALGRAHTSNGQPAVAFTIDQPGSTATAHVPLDQVEELIAGIRDTARQAATHT